MVASIMIRVGPPSIFRYTGIVIIAALSLTGCESLRLHDPGRLKVAQEVATDLEISRLLYRKAAAALGSTEGPLMAAHAKLFVPDAALRAATACTQVLGGMGLLKPYGLDRLSRLAQMLKIVDGTTEIQRRVIGRALRKRAAGLPDLAVPKGFGED